MIDAWIAGAEAEALQYAEQSVVTTIFESPTDPSAGTFQGCVPLESGAFSCGLSFEGSFINFEVGAPPGGRFRVTSANAAAD